MDMDRASRELVGRLRHMGVEPSRIPRLVGDLSNAVLAHSRANSEEIDQRLRDQGWDLPCLDDGTLELIKASLRTTARGGGRPEGRSQVQPGLAELLTRIHEQRGVDFSKYHEPTLARRIGCRLRACGVETYADYAQVLERDPREYERLLDSLTITVTEFFRDRDAFEALAHAASGLLGRTKRKSLRVWSAGCATGQEPYTVAMLLRDLHERGLVEEVAITATDIDAAALRSARGALYKLGTVQSVPRSWLDKYFEAERKQYRVSEGVANLVSFEVHNLTSDPPYQDLDVIVCRNVLIYFQPSLQAQVVRRFHDGLRRSGAAPGSHRGEDRAVA